MHRSANFQNLASEAECKCNHLRLQQNTQLSNNSKVAKTERYRKKFNVTTSTISEIKKSPETAVQFQQGNWKLVSQPIETGVIKSPENHYRPSIVKRNSLHLITRRPLYISRLQLANYRRLIKNLPPPC